MRTFLLALGLTCISTGLMAQLSGTYTIDPGLPAGPTNYQTLTSAVAALNLSGVSASVTFNIKQGVYNESVTINTVAGTSATKTVTFQPDPTNTLPVEIGYAAVGSTDNFVIRINASKYINFNGLTFKANGTSFGRIIEIQEGDTLSFNNNIFNGVFGATGSVNTAIMYGSGSTTKRIQGLSITNNTFNNGGHVVYFTATTANRNQLFVLNNNTMTGFGGYGCYLTYCETLEAIGNTMSGSALSTSTMYGIYAFGSTALATANIRAVVKENEITLPTTSTAYGIYLSGYNATVGAPSEVINNLVSIGSIGTGTRYALYTNNNNYLNIWHNSFLVRDGSPTSSRGIFFTRSTTGFTSGNNDVRNNVTVNNGGGYAAEIATDVTTVPGFFTNLNYNAYFGNGVSPFRYGATNHADLTAWKTATSAEANSVWGDPQFTSNTNLRALGVLLNDAGTNVGVTTDIDGDVRSLTTPDIGGDEFAPATCLPPTGLNITAVTPGGATINWTTSGGTNFDIQYGLAGFTPGTGTVVPATGSSFNLTSLGPNSTYDVWVRENCGAQQSVYTGPITFKTLCLAFTAPYTETFDTTLYLPQCWATFNNGGSTAVQAFWRNTSSNWMGYGATGKADNTGTPGSYALGIDGSTPVVGLSKVTLESPLINVSGLTTPYLKFFVFMNNVDNPGDNMGLYVDLWNGSTWIDSILVYAADNAAWVELNKDLSAYTITGPIQLRFNVDKTKATTAFYSDLIIDDISVIEAPACPAPSGLGVFNVSTTTASAYFTSGGAAHARVQFGPAGFTLGAGTSVIASNDTVALPGITAATTYDVYVKDSCGVGNTSVWIGPVSFSTPACEPTEKCSYGADLVDSYGDGWNGGLIGLRQNGVISATFGTGFTTGNSFSASPSICDSILTEIVVINAGSYPLEMGFTLKDPGGNPIYTLAFNTSLTNGQVLGTFTSQCTVQLCPISDSVVTINGTTCGNTSASLGAVLTNPNYNVVWFNQDTNQVGTGYSFSTPPLSTSASFWAGYVAADGNPAQSVGPPSTIGTNTTSGNFTNGVFFTALAPIRIDSMELRALNGPVVGNIRIWDTTGAGGPGFNPGAPGTLVAIVPFSVTAGISQVAVGADVMPGNYFANVQFLAGTTGQLFRSTGGATYPYTINNVVSITGTDFPTQTRYYYLFNWVVSTTCLGPLTPATAVWQPLPSTAIPYSENFNAGLPCNWNVIDSTANGATWEGVNSLNGSTLDGTPFVVLDDDGAGSAAITNSTLYTPVFDAAGYDSLWMSFDHYYRHLTGSSGKVQVFNGTTWVTLQTFTSTTGAWSAPDSAYFNLKPYQNAQLQVRFVYDDGNAYAWYWALDNIRLEGVKTPCSDVIVHVVTDIYGSEISWTVADSATGAILASGGPFADVNPYSVAAATHIDTLCLPLNGTFIFTINDSYGDGLVDGTNTGTYAVMRICPQGLDTVLSGAGALPYGGVGTPPVLAWDSVVFDLTCPAIPTYNVTFQVNMNQQTVSPNGVYLAGNFQGWSPGGTAMSDANSDGIWDVTVAMPAGGIEYKFLNDSSWSGAESVPNACQQNGNRFANITGDTTLAVVCFNQCTDCTPLVNVTFRVDMSNETVSADGVHVAGNFQGFNPGSTPLTDADGDSVYEVTVQVPSNDTLLYKFINGNTFTGVENSSQLASCGQNDGFGGYNRLTGIGAADSTLDVVCFTLCTACPIGLDENSLASGFAVFPNPNNGQFTVEFTTPIEGTYELEILDLTGRVFYREAVQNHSGYFRTELNLEHQPAGMYMVRLSGEQGQVVRRVAIQ